MRPTTASLIGLVFFTLAGCAPNDAPTAPAAPARTPSLERAQSRELESPPFNLDIVLRSDGSNAGLDEIGDHERKRGDGSGSVKFRQLDDGTRIVHLDTRLRDLAPNTAYALQRAVDTNVNHECTGSAWLTLGKGSTPQTITTDSRGWGREELFRDLSKFPVGATFDIHFRVINTITSAVVLTSECYQFTVR